MLLEIQHQTVCRYARPVPYSIQQLRLTPRIESTQRAVRWNISAPGRQRRITDTFGNVGHVLTLDQPHEEISIVVSGTVETSDQGACVPGDTATGVAPLAYLAETPLTTADEAVLALAHSTLRAIPVTIHALGELMLTIQQRVGHYPAQAGSAADALRIGGGTANDHAHLFIACCRALGIPARFVSGYFGVAAGRDPASHAWADAWVAPHGWVSFDVTHGRLAGHEYCRLAVGRDYLDACPVRGAHAGTADQEIIVRVRVQAQQQ
jgi:transglutaminase-like putative cysteine protease